MGLMTAQEYRSSLDDGRQVWLGGKRVASVATHPAFQPMVEAVASIYGLHFHPETRDLLTFALPDGTRASRFYQVPRCAEDLRLRREMGTEILRRVAPTMDRFGDETVTPLFVMQDREELVRQHDPRTAGTGRRWLDALQRRNLFMSSGNTDPKGDRSRQPGDQADPDLSLRVVRETDEGIVIRGAKFETGAAYAHVAFLTLEGLEKAYGSVRAIDGVSFAVPPAGTLALLGPSGCGKTTILRAIAGFVALDRGTVAIAGRDVTRCPPEDRGTAMVFQNYALFPHMTVAENVAYGLRVRRIPRAERDTRVAEALGLVQLTPLAARYPQQLSGGQQQRAALARAVVTRPALLLLDEPFGALDQNLRESLQIELRKLQERLALATVIVTHDQCEAMILADQVAVMQAGAVQQLAPPAAVYDHPTTRFVARFMGIDNLLDAALHPGEIRLGPYAMPVPPGQRGVRAGHDATIAVRAESIDLDPTGWPGTIAYATTIGSRILYEVAVPGIGTVKVDAPRSPGQAQHAIGDTVGIRLHPQSCTLLRD